MPTLSPEKPAVEVVRFVDKVFASVSPVIDFRMAHQADVAARKLALRHAELPFVYEISDDMYGLWLRSGNRHHAPATIYDYPAEAYRYRSLLRAVNVLAQYAPSPNLEAVGFCSYKSGEGLLEHRDKFNGGRTILTLSGLRTIIFPHESIPFAESLLHLGPGDLYSMEFTDDETSILHAVECFVPGTYLWANNYGSNPETPS